MRKRSCTPSGLYSVQAHPLTFRQGKGYISLRKRIVITVAVYYVNRNKNDDVKYIFLFLRISRARIERRRERSIIF